METLGSALRVNIPRVKLPVNHPPSVSAPPKSRNLVSAVSATDPTGAVNIMFIRSLDLWFLWMAATPPKSKWLEVKIAQFQCFRRLYRFCWVIEAGLFQRHLNIWELCLVQLMKHLSSWGNSMVVIRSNHPAVVRGSVLHRGWGNDDTHDQTNCTMEPWNYVAWNRTFIFISTNIYQIQSSSVSAFVGIFPLVGTYPAFSLMRQIEVFYASLSLPEFFESCEAGIRLGMGVGWLGGQWEMGVAMLGFKVAAPFSKDNLPLNHWVVALLRVHVESTRFLFLTFLVPGNGDVFEVVAANTR